MKKKRTIDLQQKVLEKLKEIPKGKVTTYKLIAKSLKRKGARGIARILARNPYPRKYPCYKVVCSNGKIGGYQFGVIKKKKLLQKEGIKIKNNQIENFKKVLYYF